MAADMNWTELANYDPATTTVSGRLFIYLYTVKGIVASAQPRLGRGDFQENAAIR